MKNVVLTDLIQNNLYLVEAYINTTNAITFILTMNKYIKKDNIILVVADWSN